MVTNGDGDAWEVLSEPSRRQILAELAAGPCAVGELADRLPISRPAVSQHLRVLKDAGVVLHDTNGTRRIYRVDAVALGALRDQLDTFWQRTLAGFMTVAEARQAKEKPR